MQLSEPLRDYLVAELTIVANKMKDTNDISEQVYYFSAVSGALQRVFNIEYDPKLVLMHTISHALHVALNNHLQAIQNAPAPKIRLVPDIFDVLTDLTRELAMRIQANDDVTSVVERLCVLLYSTSGNGFYLASLGRLQLRY